MSKYAVIKFNLEIEFPYPVPDDRTTPETIEDFFNNSRLCRSQLLDEITERICICDESSVEYIREATPDDIHAWTKGKVPQRR